MSDEATIERARGGDARAQRALFDAHHESVMSYCLLRTRGDRDASKDLTQEVFIRVFRGLPGLAEAGRFRAWLFTITGNVCRDYASRIARERRGIESFLVEQVLEVEPTDTSEREERMSAVRRVLEEVADPRVREIALLKYGESEYTTREIAARLGVPHGTVTVTLMRFRAAAKRSLLRALLEVEARP